MSEPKTVCLVGATGWLGQKIARVLHERGARQVLLVRGGDAHPRAKALVPYMGRRGRMLDADITRPETLARALEGVNVVISAVQGGPDVVVEGQRSLAEAARAAGVERMIPSDFCIDHREVDAADNLFLAWRRAADDAIRDVGLPQTNVLNGAFLDMLGLSLHEDPFFGLVDWSAHEVRFWGPPEQRYDFTHTDDVATAAALIALDDEAPPMDAFHLVGDRVSPAELAEHLARTTGRAFELRCLGTVDELRTEVATQRAAHPQNPLRWAGLQFHALMAAGTCTVGDTHHTRYDGFSPVDVGTWLARHVEAAS